MPITHNFIASILNSSATTVTFNNIPSSYTDLLLKISASSDDFSGGGAYFEVLTITVNGDTSTNYSVTRLIGNSSAASSTRTTSAALGDAGLTAGSLATNLTFSNTEIYFPNYNSTSSRPFSVLTAAENNSATANQSNIRSIANLYRGTSAISQISMTVDAVLGNRNRNSSFWLYGIKNS